MTQNTETPDFASMPDWELESTARFYRRSAEHAIALSRVPGPSQALHAAASNRAVKLYLQADDELRRRAQTRAAMPPEPTDDDLPDPLPSWLMTCVFAGLLVGLAVLLIRSGAV